MTPVILEIIECLRLVFEKLHYSRVKAQMVVDAEAMKPERHLIEPPCRVVQSPEMLFESVHTKGPFEEDFESLRADHPGDVESKPPQPCGYRVCWATGR